MKKVFLLIATIWDGTTPIKHDYSIYDNKEDAEKVNAILQNLNKKENFHLRISYNIEEIMYYNDIAQIPIIKSNKNENT